MDRHEPLREDPGKDPSDERYGIFYDRSTRQLTINFHWYHIAAVLLLIVLIPLSYHFYALQIPPPAQKQEALPPVSARPETPPEPPEGAPRAVQRNSRVVSSSLLSVTVSYYDKGYRNAKFVTLDLNGQPVEFLLDTGASYVAVTPETVRRLGIHDFIRTAQAMTANGPVSFYLFTMPSMKVGHLEVADVECAYMPTLHENLLGGSFLSHFHFTINESDHSITFRVKEGETASSP